MKKRKFSVGGVTDDDLEVANASEDPIQTLNKRKGWTDTGEDDNSGAAPVAAPTPKSAPKQRVVSKKELEESGLSLRDFLNKERGLKRKEEPKVTDTGDEVARLAARKPRVKGALEFGPEITYPRKVRSPYESRETASSEPAKPKEERLLKNLKMAKPSEFTGMGSMKFAKGGTTSSASRRADGIAQRGKTKGKMY